MATPPTVLASAASAPPVASTPPAPAAERAKFPVLPLVIAVVVGVVIAALGIGGAVYALARSGRLPVQAAAVKSAPAPVATHLMALDPLVVNLADAGHASFVKVSVVLQVADAASGKDAARSEEKAPEKAGGNEAMIEARDTALTVLGRETSDVLLAADGKDRLKAELKAALLEHNPDLKVVDVFFTDFLVQR
ncbi:flagellar basal body-associated FliL family protein [Edaphobacter sp.]|uniref:flagellar basal body-associated FliL family protein n=1 Tax=Edaphobacter sp. TaxID=1934404 RepID=UPI002DB5E423|nr:flagellar basal body-associated FliL family protein [Edaphobacter sp.]HEU5342640.1 flagellar basal body-associated FliL family protein [Edaphobacter sp.]